MSTELILNIMATIVGGLVILLVLVLGSRVCAGGKRADDAMEKYYEAMLERANRDMEMKP